MAFCLTLYRENAFSEPQKIQLVMRKNCMGESLLEFEDSLGHSVKIKAACVSDLESDPNDP